MLRTYMSAVLKTIYILQLYVTLVINFIFLLNRWALYIKKRPVVTLTYLKNSAISDISGSCSSRKSIVSSF